MPTTTVTPQALADEIIYGINEGFLGYELKSIASFSELHDICDANMLIIQARVRLGLPEIDDDADFTIDNAATEIVSEYLQSRVNAAEFGEEV